MVMVSLQLRLLTLCVHCVALGDDPTILVSQDKREGEEEGEREGGRERERERDRGRDLQLLNE